MDQIRKVGAHRPTRLAGAVLVTVVLAGSLGGCVYKTEKEKVVPSVVVAPSDRVVSATDGRWQLYGDGTATSPYYWAWIPSGATPPPPPPLPKGR